MTFKLDRVAYSQRKAVKRRALIPLKYLVSYTKQLVTMSNTIFFQIVKKNTSEELFCNVETEYKDYGQTINLTVSKLIKYEIYDLNINHHF